MSNDGDRIFLTVTKLAVVESRLDGHEDVCAKRYAEIATGFDKVQGQLSEINAAVRGVLIAAVLMLLGMLGTIFYNGLPWAGR